jgi:hypothetical protein
MTTHAQAQPELPLEAAPPTIPSPEERLDAAGLHVPGDLGNPLEESLLLTAAALTRSRVLGTEWTFEEHSVLGTEWTFEEHSPSTLFQDPECLALQAFAKLGQLAEDLGSYPDKFAGGDADWLTWAMAQTALTQAILTHLQHCFLRQRTKLEQAKQSIAAQGGREKESSPVQHGKELF